MSGTTNTNANGRVVMPAVPQPQLSTDVVGFDLQNNQANALGQRYITFQQTFLPGRVTTSTHLVAIMNGQTIPVQMDVKTTNADGSVRSALLTFEQPPMAANSSLSGMLSTTGTAFTTGPLSLANLNDSNYNFKITIALQGGSTVVLDAATLLQQGLKAGTVSYWQAGPLATQGRVDVPIAGSLHVTLDITMCADGNTSTDVQFNNDYAMQPVSGTAVYNVTIQQNGSTVLQQSNITEYQYQTWHTVVSTNGPSQVNVVQDINYLEQTGAVPNLDLTAGVDPSTLSAEVITGNQILGPGSVTQYMPTTGGRPDVGPMPAWNAIWLMTQNQQAAQYALVQADAAGSVPWHFFDPKTGTYLSLDNYPTLWADPRGTPTLTQQPSGSSGWTPDAAHQPDLSYVAYLTTGDRYYLDQLNAQATFDEFDVWPSPRQNGLGLVANGYDQVRQQAWSLRDIDEAAWANPAGSVEQTTFAQLANNNWSWLVSQIPVWTQEEGQAYGYVPGAYGNGSGSTMAPWQQDYFASTAIQAAEMGNSNALTFLNWEANFLVGRFLNSANGFNPHDGVAYNLNIGNGTGADYQTWAQIEQATVAAGNSNGSGWANGNYAELAAQTLAGIITVTGSTAAMQAYDWLMSSGAPEITPNFTDPQFDVVPGQAVATGNATLAIAAANATQSDGATGTTTPFTFAVTRGGNTSIATSANWAVSGSGSSPAPASAFAGGVLPSGTVSFAAGQTSQTITVNVAGNSTLSVNEGFTVTLSNPAASTTIGTATAIGSILAFGGGTTLMVGQGKQFATIAAAVTAAHSGDTILVDAGNYTNDFPGTINKNLTLVGVGGMAHMVATTAPPNGKGILDVGGSGVNVTIENFEFSGAAVADGNGAGIRYEGGSLTLIGDYFHNNQDGLLAASDKSGSITINSSEFAQNGTSSGLTHDIYVNAVNALIIDDSYIHDAILGHEIKSRALSTTITNSRIYDGTGTASYSIDIPNGGVTVIKNNVIEQGPNSQNPIIINYGEEGSVYTGSSLTIDGNTVVNDLTAHVPTMLNNATTVAATVTDNSVYGLTSNQILSGPATVSGTTFLSTRPTLDTSAPWLGDTIFGTAGADTLVGTAGADTMAGGAGNDIYYVDNIGDQVIEAVGGGTDTVYASTSWAMAADQEIEYLLAYGTAATSGVTLTGNDLGTYLRGGSGSDTLTGGAGNDRLNGLAGADVMAGGGGNDTYYVDDPGDQVIEAVGGGTDTVYASTSWAMAAGQEIEYLLAYGTAATSGVTLTGNDLGTYLRGGSGSDTLTGGAGNDRLNGLAGADVMTGGGGNDTYYVDDAGDQVIEAVGGGTDTVYASTSWAMAAGQEIEYLLAYGTAATSGVTLTGNDLGTYLRGGSGSDTLTGGAGNDRLNGLAGADVMTGGGGNDTYYVDDPGDQVIEAVGGGTDTVYASTSWAMAADQEIEYLLAYGTAATSGVTLTGNDLGTYLRGGSGSDTLTGGAGNDRLNGLAGADVMTGGGGNDTYYVDDAGDQVIEAVGGGTDTVYASTSWMMAAGQEIEYLQASGPQDLSLSGNELVNTLIGGTGNDTLDGGLGNDRLTGGAGNDAFLFDSALGSGNVDTITDFSTAGDTIVLDHAVFTGLSAGLLSASAFELDSATGAGPQIVYNHTTGALFYDSNGSAPGGSTQFATITGAPNLNNNYFKVV